MVLDQVVKSFSLDLVQGSVELQIVVDLVFVEISDYRFLFPCALNIGLVLPFDEIELLYLVLVGNCMVSLLNGDIEAGEHVLQGFSLLEEPRQIKWTWVINCRRDSLILDFVKFIELLLSLH